MKYRSLQNKNTGYYVPPCENTETLYLFMREFLKLAAHRLNSQPNQGENTLWRRNYYSWQLNNYSHFPQHMFVSWAIPARRLSEAETESDCELQRKICVQLNRLRFHTEWVATNGEMNLLLYIRCIRCVILFSLMWKMCCGSKIEKHCCRAFYPKAHSSSLHNPVAMGRWMGRL